MTPKKQVPAKLPTPGGQQLTKTQSADLSAGPSGSQQIIVRLKAIANLVDTIPIPEGELGRDLLEALELTDRVRDRIRARVKARRSGESARSPGRAPAPDPAGL
jgi:hypothetical protein